MIQCTKCRIQYIGETKRRLSDRFGEHRRAVEKAITQRGIDKPTAVSDHFTLPGHSLSNLELIPFELINSNRDAIRLTNRFHVAVRLFSNGSQMTAKCDKNKKVAHET